DVKFFDHILLAGGDHSRREHDSAALLPEAVAVFRGMLAAGPWFSRAPVPAAPPGYSLTWTEAGRGAAAATFWFQDVPVTTSALLAGLDADAEAEVTGQIQEMTLRFFAGTPLEPGFDLAEIAERPVIISLILPSAFAAGGEAVALVADCETCL